MQEAEDQTGMEIESAEVILKSIHRDLDDKDAKGKASEAESRGEVPACADEVAVAGTVSPRMIVHHSSTPCNMDRGTQTIRVSWV